MGKKDLSDLKQEVQALNTDAFEVEALYSQAVPFVGSASCSNFDSDDCYEQEVEGDCAANITTHGRRN